MSIGSGQHIWLRLWNKDEPIADGVLEPGADVEFTFVVPQTVTAVSLTRITHEDAERLVAETGVQQIL